MASKKDQYFIQVPKENGTFEYVSVDVNRLGRHTVATLYSKVDQRDGRGSSFKPAFGAEVLVAGNLDLQEFEQIHDELTEQMRLMLEASGAGGALVYQNTIEKLQLLELARALGKGQTAKATDILRTMLYDLMSGTAELSKIAVSHEEAIATTGALSDYLKHNSDISREVLINMAIEVESLLTTVNGLKSCEAELLALISIVEQASRGWRQELPEAINDAKKFLDGYPESFLLRAYGYAIEEGSLSEAARVDIETAERHRDICYGYEEKIMSSWNEVNEIVLKKFAVVQPRYSELIQALRDASRKLREFREHYKNVPEPYMIPGETGKPLVTRNQYEQAMAILADHRWDPVNCQQRLEELVRSASGHRGSKPRLPEDLQNILEQVDGYLEKFKEEERAPHAVESKEEIEEGGGAETAPTSLQRSQELYEVMMCVGYVLTCKRPFMAASSVRSMLRVVSALGRCTPEEAKTYIPAVRSLVDTSIERVKVGTEVTNRWRKSKVRWIGYRFRANASLKMTENSEAEMKKLLHKLQLDTDIIRAAYVTMRQEHFPGLTETD